MGCRFESCWDRHSPYRLRDFVARETLENRLSRWQGEASDGSSAFDQRGSAARYRMARQDGPHRHLESVRPGPAHGAASQHRRRRSRRSGWTWRRATGRLCLPDRLLSLLAIATRPQRLELWTIRREFHRRRAVRQRGVHRRSLPDRGCAARSDAAARHLLSGRHPHERAADGSAARRARQTRLLLSRHRGGRGRGRRRDRAGRGGSRAHDRRRGQCAVVQARLTRRAGWSGPCASRR